MAQFWAAARVFLFSKASRLALGILQPPIQWVPDTLSPWTTQMRICSCDHSATSSTEVTNAWSYISTPPTPSKHAQEQLYLYFKELVANITMNQKFISLNSWPYSSIYGTGCLFIKSHSCLAEQEDISCLLPSTHTHTHTHTHTQTQENLDHVPKHLSLVHTFTHYFLKHHTVIWWYVVA